MLGCRSLRAQRIPVRTATSLASDSRTACDRRSTCSWWSLVPAAWWPTSDDDPRLSIATSFRTSVPKFTMLATRACADCHAAISASYRNTRRADRLADRRGRPDRALRRRCSPSPSTRNNGSVSRRSERERSCPYRDDRRNRIASGVGLRGRLGAARLSILIDRDGFLLSTRLRGNPLKNIWTCRWATMKYNEHMSSSDHSGLPVVPTAIKLNRRSRRQSLSVARCFHGPCDRLRAMPWSRPNCMSPSMAGKTAGAIDATIVNPRHSASPTARVGVRQQCHLQGEARVPWCAAAPN